MVRQPREGVGLGLFIAQSLVSAHDGRIEVASALRPGNDVHDLAAGGWRRRGDVAPA